MRYFKLSTIFFSITFKQQRNTVTLWLNSFGYVPAKKRKAEKNIKNTCKISSQCKEGHVVPTKISRSKINPGEF